MNSARMDSIQFLFRLRSMMARIEEQSLALFARLAEEISKERADFAGA